MKAVVYTEYGAAEVLHFTEIPKPSPKDGEVLVRVHATTVTIGDTIMRSLNIPLPGWQRFLSRLYLGINKPKRPVLGMELCGEVEAVGKKVTRYKPGDLIFASTFKVNFGGYTEYKCLPENGVMAHKPENLTPFEAAAAPGAGMTALQCLKKGNPQPGKSILIYGASGAVGTNAIQLASRYFKMDVTGVCSTTNLELVRSLGANQVIDYTCQDFTENGQTYDVVFDAVGKLDTLKGKKVLKTGGVYINVRADSDGGNNLENLLTLKNIIEDGYLKPVIDKVYPFEKIVEAHRYVEKEHKKGNVVINILQSEINGGEIK